jgi:transcriptional regulator with XRE-family HTH domain
VGAAPAPGGRPPRAALRAARQRMGLSQREAAEALAAFAYRVDHVHVGVSASMVSKWERGEKGVS